MVKPETPSETYGPTDTNWYILTGAPCSGKTSVINELARRGFGVVHEVARAHIEMQLAAGCSLDQIRHDEAAFEQLILDKKAAIEKNLPPGGMIFFDRAVPDSIAYFRLAGLDPSAPIALSRRFRYRKIFLLERLPARKDAVRKEDDRTARTIETLLVECYGELGYPLVRIPVSTVPGRADQILEHLE